MGPTVESALLQPSASVWSQERVTFDGKGASAPRGDAPGNEVKPGNGTTTPQELLPITESWEGLPCVPKGLPCVPKQLWDPR